MANPITVLVNVSSTAPAQVFNMVSVSGGGSVAATDSDTTIITPYSLCDINRDSTTNIGDVMAILSQVLNTATPANDLNGDGVVNVLDVQIVINAVLGQGCAAH
jgi:hypothetical protein